MARITSLLFALPVSDLQRAVTFYRQAFELEPVFEAEQIVFVGIPGTDMSFGLLLDPSNAGAGPQNVGLHLDHAIDREGALREIESAGGRIVERGEHGPGVPFARMADLDGNVLEI